jgi:hypothetical protein
MNTKPLLSVVALVAFVAGCSDATGSSAGRVAIRFGTEPAGAARSIGSDANAAMAVALADEVVATGTNGTLKIEDIQFIVSEVTLKRAENAACRHEAKQGGKNDGKHENDANDDCKKFEGGPFLVDLPLGGGVVTVLQADVPPGTFRAVEFEIDDFEMDDDDDNAEHVRSSELFAQLRALYPNVPARANMVVKGVFTPTAGAARPFIVYFNADIEIKQRFEEPLVVEEGGGVTVRIDPTKWFIRGNQVRDLSALDGKLVEFEFEMRQGFIKAECDHDR